MTERRMCRTAVESEPACHFSFLVTPTLTTAALYRTTPDSRSLPRSHFFLLSCSLQSSAASCEPRCEHSIEQ